MRALPGERERSASRAPTASGEESVAERQRVRIREATVELIAARGYQALSIEAIISSARVGPGTFYRHYESKLAPLLDAYDRALGRLREEIAAATQAPEMPWPQQVAVALQAIFAAVIREPALARCCLLEGSAAGRPMIERRERSIAALAALLRGGRHFNPAADALPSGLEQALAGSVFWSVYEPLVLGETARLEPRLPQAIEFVLRPYVGGVEPDALLVGAPGARPPSAAPAPLPGGEAERARVLAALAELVARRGYGAVTDEQLAERSGLGLAALRARFASKEDAFIELLDEAESAGRAAMLQAAEASGGEWPERLAAALRALYELIAAQPAVARACLSESLLAGPRVSAHYVTASQRMMVPLLSGGRQLRAEGELPETLEETLVASFSHLLYRRLVRGEATRIDDHLPEALEFLLGPYVGSEDAPALAERALARQGGPVA